MKVSLLTVAVLLSTQSWAGMLQEGTYHGHGKWNSPLKSGSYETQTTIDEEGIESVYKLPDGSTKTWAFEIQPTNGNFFKVLVDDEEVGSGYCISEAPVCHYEVSMGKLDLEETITIQNNHLYRFGSKEDSSGKVMWQEALE